MRFTIPAAVAALALPMFAVAAAGSPGVAAPAAASCDAFTAPVYAGNVPSPPTYSVLTRYAGGHF